MFFEIIGWIGMILSFLAFLLITFKVITPVSLLYQGLNIFAGIGLMINNAYHFAWPGFSLSAIWTIVALFVFLKILISKNKKNIGK
ncbi:hypothetical protein J7K86_00490 [bacterium]|nr:hypothetical protein [bacterium]